MDYPMYFLMLAKLDVWINTFYGMHIFSHGKIIIQSKELSFLWFTERRANETWLKLSQGAQWNCAILIYRNDVSHTAYLLSILNVQLENHFSLYIFS